MYHQTETHSFIFQLTWNEIFNAMINNQVPTLLEWYYFHIIMESHEDALTLKRFPHYWTFVGVIYMRYLQA